MQFFCGAFSGILCRSRIMLLAGQLWGGQKRIPGESTAVYGGMLSASILINMLALDDGVECVFQNMSRMQPFLSGMISKAIAWMLFGPGCEIEREAVSGI